MTEAYGEKIVDNYGIITRIGLMTFKEEGNLLISVNTFDKALRRIARLKFKKIRKTIYTSRPEKLSATQKELYDACVKEAMLDCARRSGYSSCTFRVLEKASDGDVPCIIIERADGGKIGWQ